MSLFNELKRRNIFKVAMAYIALGWVVVQVTDVVVPALNLPETLNTIVVYIGLIGFPFALFFAWAFELTPEGVKRTEEVELEESIRETTGQKINYIIIGLLSMAVVLLLLKDIFYDRGPAPEPEEEIVAEVPAERENTIAVMPFADMSPDGSQEYFGDGIAEEILNVLVSVDDLKVTSRTSSFAYKSTNTQIPQIAEELNVNYVLEGSIRTAGDNVRVTAQLIDVAADQHLWSDTFDRDLSDIFAIQDEISVAIANALKVELLGEVLGDIPTQSLEAYELYLQAKLLRNKNTLEDHAAGKSLLDRAIALDPNFAESWAVLSLTIDRLIMLRDLSDDEIASDFALSLAAATKAISLKPDLAVGWAAKGHYHIHFSEWPEGYSALQQAIKLNPKDAESWKNLAQFHRISFGPAEALVAFRTAYELNPLDTVNGEVIGNMLLLLGRTEEASIEIDIALERGLPDASHSRALIFLMNGDKGEAAELLASYMQLSTESEKERLNVFIDAYFDPSLRQESANLLAPRDVMPTRTHIIEALLIQNSDFIVHVFDKANENPSVLLPFLQMPPYRAILNQQDIKNEIIKNGLPDFWNQTSWPLFCRPVGNDDYECQDVEGNWP